MSTRNIDKILANPVLITKTPITFYMITLLISLLFVLFATFAATRRIGIPEAIICFLFISFLIYANFGRFLAKIKLYDHKIEVDYIFPWYSSIVFEFDRFSELEHNVRLIQLSLSQWYIPAQKLYLKTNAGETCLIKYNINSNDDEQLVKLLSKKLIP